MPHNRTPGQYFDDLWAIKPDWLRSAIDSIRSGLLKPQQPIATIAMAAGQNPTQLYNVSTEQIAVIHLAGELIKGDSSFGGTSTVRVRKALREAVGDPSVDAIMLHVDSPGGTVPGITELHDEIVRAKKKKPVRAHIDDLGASAALWAVAGAGWLTANRTAEIGSIGVFAVVYDSSGAAKAEGVEVHVISTGANKGAFVPGAPVTDEQLGNLRERVDGISELFVSAIAKGRKMPGERVKELATGEVWLAQNALERGLIDDVMPFEAAMADFAKEVKALRRARKTRAEIVRAQIAAMGEL